MKIITGLKVTQSEKAFKNEDGEVVSYHEYLMTIDGREIRIKPGNDVAKVRMMDAFEKVPEMKG